MSPPAGTPFVLVTGAKGLIGSRIVADLRRDHRVVGMDIHPGPGEWVQCDLTEDADVARALEDVRTRFGDRIQSVVHLAAHYDFSGEPSPLYRELTVEGTRRLLRGLRTFTEVEQIVFSSSLLVMASAPPGEPLTEASPVEAEWDYPRSKLEAEDVVRTEAGSIPAVVLRFAGVYDEEGHSIPLAQHVRRIREKDFESFFFPGRRDHGQSFVHLDDLVECFRLVVERRSALGAHEVFLIGEPDTMSYEELQVEIGHLVHGVEWPTIRIPAPIAKAGAWIKEKVGGGHETFIKPWMVDLADINLPVDITRARERLGWEPRRSLRTSLPAMIAKLEEDPERWYRENDLPPPEGGAREDGREVSAKGLDVEP